MYRFRVYGFAGTRYTYVRIDGVGAEGAALAAARKHYPQLNVYNQWGKTLVVKCP